jgi:uncharacterized protein YegJ (DUF2314 family)
MKPETSSRCDSWHDPFVPEPGGPRQTKCATHGSGAEGYLCRHLIENVGLEFHHAELTEETPFPDAWCGGCEKLRRRAGGWDQLDASTPPPIALVCGHCYQGLLERHESAPTSLLGRLRRLLAARPRPRPRPNFIPNVVHDDAVLAASRKAHDRLRSELKPRFIAGLSAGERLLVKAPFAAAGGGKEWMWVLVKRWEGPRIHGVLDNDPVRVPTLKAGAHVDVLEDELLDYDFVRKDGSSEGNETALLMHGRR